jgi:hypothetical protein
VGWERGAHSIWYPILESGLYLWTPPPAAAVNAIEELRRARLKRQESTHVLVCPRLMTPYWRRQLHRVSDLVFEIPAGAVDCWPSSHHEPLVVAIVFPFLRFRPWQLGGSPKFRALERQLRSVWKENPSYGCTLLRKLFIYARDLQSLQDGVVSGVLSTEDHGLVLHRRT